MKRTTAPNNQSNRYVDQTGSVPGTTLIAEDRNLIQEELCNLLEDFGIALDGGNEQQISELLQDYLNQKLKTTDDVTFDQITADGILKSNDYFQMRTGVAYNTGTITAGSNFLLPIGWYLPQSTTAATAQFRTDSGVALIYPIDNTGGFCYSDGSVYIRNTDSVSHDYSFKRF